jgi:hypothetical protein
LTLTDIDEKYGSENYGLTPGHADEQGAILHSKHSWYVNSMHYLDLNRIEHTPRSLQNDTDNVSRQSYRRMPPYLSEWIATESQSQAIVKSEPEEVPTLLKTKDTRTRECESKTPKQALSNVPADLYGPNPSTRDDICFPVPADDVPPPQLPGQPADELENDALAHSVFGTGSWIVDNTVDVRAQKIEGFAATELASEPRTHQDNQVDDSVKEHAGESKEAGPGSQNEASDDSNGSGSMDSRQDPSNNCDQNNKRISDGSEGDRGSGSRDGDGDGNHDKLKKQKKSPQRRFGCHFNKNDPLYFKTSLRHSDDPEKYMICAAGMGWENCARLK